MVSVDEMFPEGYGDFSRGGEFSHKPPSDEVQKWIEAGFSHCFNSYYLCTLRDEEFLKINLHWTEVKNTSHHAIVTLKTGLLPKIQANQDVLNGRVAFFPEVALRKIRSRVLWILVPFRSDDDLSTARLTARTHAACIRLTTGLAGAVELLVEQSHELGTDNFKTEVAMYSVNHFHLKRDEDVPIPHSLWDSSQSSFGYQLYDIGADAERLFMASVEERDNDFRFLLLWLALESQIGNGSRVKQFFQRKSKTIPEEVSRLAKVRGDIAHKGKVAATTTDYYRLLPIFRIGCLKNHDAVKSAINDLEKSLEVDCARRASRA